MRSATVLVAIAAGLALPVHASATITASTPPDAAALAGALAGRGVQIANLSFSSSPSQPPVGLYSGATWQPGFETGVIISSGNNRLVLEPASPGGYIGQNNVDNGGGADPDLDYSLPGLPQSSPTNSASVTFDATPAGPVLRIPYVFGSEEYGQTPANRFMDRMGIFVGGSQCALTADGKPMTTKTFDATTPTGNTLYVDNTTPAAGTPGMAGLSRPLSCSVPVTPGVAVHVKIAVADGTDTLTDSGVLLPTHGLESNQPPVAQLSVPAGVTAGQPAALSTSGSADPDGTLASWSLDFGDGSNTSGSGVPTATITHTYSAGSFTAILTVTDADGLSASSPAQFNVVPPPVIIPPKPLPLVTANAHLKGHAGKQKTVIALALSHLPAGSTATLSCTPRGRCPFSHRSPKVRAGKLRVSGLTFKPGAKLTIVLRAPRHRGEKLVYRFKAGHLPKPKKSWLRTAPTL